MPWRDPYVVLLEDLIAAPGGAAGWQTFLSHLCELLNGTAASFISIDSSSSDARIAVTVRTDPAALDAYQQHWQKFDPWARGIARSRPASGAVLLGDQLVSSPLMRRTEFYNEFGRHHGITRCVAGLIEVSPHTFSCISINRGDQHDPFHEDDRDLLAALVPHIQRALQVHRRLGAGESLAGHVGDVISRVSHGVLLLTSSGRVVFANRMAERLLAAHDGLRIELGELRAETSASTSALRQAIRGAEHQSIETPPASLVRLERRSAKRPLVLVVTPLSRHIDPFDHERATVAIFVTDPDYSPVPDVEFLRSTLLLTTAEARLVSEC
jgi:hypothetical protein